MITIKFTIEHMDTDQLLGYHTKRFLRLQDAIDYMYKSYYMPENYPHLPENSGLFSEELESYMDEIQPIRQKYMRLLQSDIDVPDDAVIDFVELL